jgi:hypothetical protein
MWRVSALETRRAAMDFTSSGQGRPTMSQLVFDGAVVANAIELTDWSESPFNLKSARPVAMSGVPRAAGPSSGARETRS